MNSFVPRSLRRSAARRPGPVRKARLSAAALEDRVVPSAPPAPPGFTSSLTAVTSTTPVDIDPNSPNTQTATIVVSGAGTYLHDLDVFMKMTHTWCSDMAITLTSPAGTTVTLTSFNGGSLDNLYNGTLWDDDADPGNPAPYSSPLSASKLATDTVSTNLVVETELTPEEPLAAFRGENPNGTWTMTLHDAFSADGGTLSEWRLDVSTLNGTPATPPADTFVNNTPQTISATGTPVVTSQIAVSGLLPYVQKLTLKTNLTHTNSANLDITLTSPAGTSVTLTTDNGSTLDNVFNGTIWDDDADPGNVTPYPAANSKMVTDTTYTNLVPKPTLTPEEPLGAFIGENPNGTWTLTVSDDATADGGTLAGWELIVVTPPDTISPEVTVEQAPAQPDPTNGTSIAYSVVFNEAVTGFTGSDIDFTGSTVGGTLQANVTGSGTTYTVTVTGMDGEGAVVVSVPAGAATDKAGNPNKASTSVDNTVIYDAVGPTVTINQAAGQPDPATATDPIVFDVVFSEPAVGFDGSDIDFSGSTVGGALQVTVTGSGTTYTVSVTGMDGVGTLVVSVPADAVTDALGNSSSASTSTDNEVVVDTIGQVQFDPPVYAIAETGGTITITATRTGGSANAVTVDFATVGGTATAGKDYTAASGTLSWANGETGPKTFVVTLLDDTLVEGDETITLALSDPTNGLVLGADATATIDLEDLEEGLIQITKAVFTAAEGGGLVTITVSRTDGVVGDVTVDYATANATARAGLDYKATTGTLSWDEGVGGEQTFEVEVLEDSANEGRELIQLLLSNPTNGSRLGLAEAHVSIAPSDPKDSKQVGAFFDADADAGAIKLTGAGTARYYLTDPDGDGKGPIELIELSDTNANSVLNLSIRKSKTTADNGLVTLGGVTGTELKALNARGITLSGDINLSGPLGSLTIGDVVNGADIVAGGLPTQKSRITAGIIGDGTDITLGTSLAGLTATRVGDGTITVPSVGLLAVRGNTRLAIPGDFAADLDVSGAEVAAGKPAVQTAQVFGAVTADSDWAVGGTVNLVLAGSFNGTRAAGGLTVLTVKETLGGDVTLSGVGVPANKPALGTLSVGQHVMDTSVVTAPSIGTVTVKGVLSGDLTVTGSALPTALRTLRVIGAVSGSDILVDGSVGSVVVGAFRDSRLFAGYAGADDGSGTFTRSATVGTFNVLDRNGGYENSTAIATTFKAVSLASIVPDNGGDKYGFLADRSIGSLRVQAPQPFVYVPTDLSVQGVEDFEVRIV